MHHPTAITFYDELGVAPNAAPEEIRDSFRALVRILHPDHQTDEQLKEIAERQMRKLNRIYAVLSDPEKRRRYNELLEEEDLGPTIILSPNSNVNVRRLMERVAWIAAFATVVVTLIWLSAENPASAPPQISDRNPKKSVLAAPAPSTAPDEVDRLRSDLRLLKMERDAAVNEVIRLRASHSRTPTTWTPAEPSAVAALPLPTAMTEFPAPALPAPSSATNLAPSRVPQPKLATSPVRPFAGFWFYNKPASHSRTSALYPPEFIETTITEQDGVVRGKYRSRYKIVDRAISPDVTFEFAGTTIGSTMVCPWTGPGGAKGELTLKIAGENAMLVNWTATELGSIQGLITGTATLTRRID